MKVQHTYFGRVGVNGPYTGGRIEVGTSNGIEKAAALVVAMLQGDHGGTFEASDDHKTITSTDPRFTVVYQHTDKFGHRR